MPRVSNTFLTLRPYFQGTKPDQSIFFLDNWIEPDRTTLNYNTQRPKLTGPWSSPVQSESVYTRPCRAH